MIKLLHIADIHLGTTTHGKINPATGLNTRVEDFRQALGRCLERAIVEQADLVLFGGDAFPDATPAPLVQQAFAEEFRRLGNIPTIFLVGNHDQYAQGQGGSSLVIYRSLAIPNVIVGDRLQTHTIETKSGNLQVITLPWLTKSVLLTRQETTELDTVAVEALFREKLAIVLEAEIRQLNPDLPTILLAHVMVEGASFGAEKFLATGKGFNLPLSWLARPEFTYVALGHVHRHQCLCHEPPVVYPGSIERVDFGEESEAKGYCWVEIDRPHQARWQFCPLEARPFCTLRVDVRSEDDPHHLIIQAIQNRAIEGAIVRLIYQINAEQLALLNEPEIHQNLAIAHSYSIIPEVISQDHRTRLSQLDPLIMLDPIIALETYLATRPEWKEFGTDLLQLAQELLADSLSPSNQLSIDI